MPATLTRAYPQSFAMRASNTQLLSFKPLALAGIKDIWKLRADTWTPTSHTSSRASNYTRTRAALISLMMVGPAVADTRIIPAFVSSAGVDQPLTRTLHGPREEQWAGIYVIAGVQPVWTSGMVAGVVLVGPAARSHASRACVRRWPVLWGQSAYAFHDAVCSHVHVWMRWCCGCAWAAVGLSPGAELAHGAGGWMRCSGAASGDREGAGGAPTFLHRCHVANRCLFKKCTIRAACSARDVFVMR